MSSLYFILPYLDPLYPDSVPSLGVSALRDFLLENLPSFYHKSIEHILLFVDLKNIPMMWSRESVEVLGNFSLAQLHDALLLQDFLPEYLLTALQVEKEGGRGHQDVGSAFWEYFQKSVEFSSTFILEYMGFLKKLWIALLAYRCTQAGISLQDELSFEGEKDSDIQFFIQQKGRNFTPPSEFSALFQELASVCGKANKEDDIVHRFHFYWLESWRDSFSMDSLLAYLVQFILLSQRNERSLTQKKEELIKKLGNVRW